MIISFFSGFYLVIYEQRIEKKLQEQLSPREKKRFDEIKIFLCIFF